MPDVLSTNLVFEGVLTRKETRSVGHPQKNPITGLAMERGLVFENEDMFPSNGSMLLNC